MSDDAVFVVSLEIDNDETLLACFASRYDADAFLLLQIETEIRSLYPDRYYQITVLLESWPMSTLLSETPPQLLSRHNYDGTLITQLVPPDEAEEDTILLEYMHMWELFSM